MELNKKNKCLICNLETRAILTSDKKYYKCHQCEFVYLDRAYVLSKEEEKARYSLHQNSIENKGYVKMFDDFIAKAVEPYLSNFINVNALDFGSGPGPVLGELLKKRGVEIELYDPYFAPCKNYQKREYDLIVSTEVFEHLVSPLSVLQELVSLLKTDGMIAIMTLLVPDDDYLFQKWWYRRDPTHISFFSINTFSYLADLIGLKLLYSDNKKIIVLKKRV